MKNIKSDLFQLTELFQNFNYKLPSDPELILYDFYFLTGIADQTVIPEETVEFIVKETIAETTDALQVHMIKALKFSLTVEMRHIFDMFSWSGPGSTKLAKEYPDFIREFYREIFKNKGGNSNVPIDWNAEIPEIMDRIEGSMIYSGNAGERMNAFKAILRVQKTLRLDNIDLARIYEDFYQNGNWNSSYGGPKWAQIARAWQKLITAKKHTEKVIWIDHAYDLQHNTSTVFNKIKAYVKGGSYAWIGSALDWKRDLTDARAFYNRVSMTLRPLVSYISKLFSGESMQDFGMSGAIAKGAAQADDLDVFKKVAPAASTSQSTSATPKIPDMTGSVKPGFKKVSTGPPGIKWQIVDVNVINALSPSGSRKVKAFVSDYFYGNAEPITQLQGGVYSLSSSIALTGIKFDPKISVVFGFASSKGTSKKVSIKQGTIVGGDEEKIKKTFDVIGAAKFNIIKSSDSINFAGLESIPEFGETYKITDKVLLKAIFGTNSNAVVSNAHVTKEFVNSFSKLGVIYDQLSSYGIHFSSKSNVLFHAQNGKVVVSIGIIITSKDNKDAIYADLVSKGSGSNVKIMTDYVGKGVGPVSEPDPDMKGVSWTLGKQGWYKIVDDSTLKEIFYGETSNGSAYVTNDFVQQMENIDFLKGIVHHLGITFSRVVEVVFGMKDGNVSIERGTIKLSKNNAKEILKRVPNYAKNDVVLISPAGSTPPNLSVTVQNDDEFVKFSNFGGNGDWLGVYVTPKLNELLKSNYMKVKWIKNADISNCNISYDREMDAVKVMGKTGFQSTYTGWWKNGIMTGVVFNGTWKNGKFIESIFQSGEWFLGHFDKSSTFIKGKWHRQKYAYQGGYNGIKFAAPPNAEIVK